MKRKYLMRRDKEERDKSAEIRTASAPQGLAQVRY